MRKKNEIDKQLSRLELHSRRYEHKMSLQTEQEKNIGYSEMKQMTQTSLDPKSEKRF